MNSGRAMQSVPLSYASGESANAWREGARVWGIFALVIGTFRAIVSALWTVQSLLPYLGIVRRSVYSWDKWTAGIHIATFVVALLLAGCSAGFLLRRRGRKVIVVACFMLCILSLLLAVMHGARELENYGYGRNLPTVPFFVLLWSAIFSLEGIPQATFYLMLGWLFMRMKRAA